MKLYCSKRNKMKPFCFLSTVEKKMKTKKRNTHNQSNKKTLI